MKIEFEARFTRGRAVESRVSTLEALGAFGIFASLFVITNALLGKDLNWDFFNYHRYAALNLYQSRLTQDFFAAGYQGYMNPLPYAPFAWMLHAGWHSLVIGSVLAIIHSLNAFFLYLICRAVLVRNDFPRTTAILSTLLGCSTGAFVSQIGSSFVDPLTTVPVMAGLWLLVTGSSLPRSALVGALVGFSVALKLTNAPYAIGLYAALLAAAWGGKSHTRHLCRTAFAGAGGGLAAFLVAYAPWGLKLYQAYGSPVFPLFNSLFKAPDFPGYSIALDRFVPQGFMDALTLPFRMLSSASWIYTEIQAPDIRPTVVLIGLAAWGGMVAWKRVFQTRQTESSPACASAIKERTVFTFFAAALPVWIMTSSNGRYAIPLLLLLGPLLFLVWQKALGDSGARVALGTCVVLESVAMTLAGSPRWNPMPWTPDWLPASVPSELKETPQLYVTIGLSSESYLAAEVHPDSSFVNPIGLLSIPTGGPGWGHFISLREKYAGAIQVVLPPAKISTAAGRKLFLDTHNAIIERLGLHINESSCLGIDFNTPEDSISFPWITGSFPKRSLTSCAAVATAPTPRIDENRARAEKIMNELEDHCPNIFQPPRPQIEGDGVNWARLYGKHDIILSLDFGENRTLRYRQDRQGVQTVVGSVDTADQNINHFACRLPYGGSRGIDTLSADESR